MRRKYFLGCAVSMAVLLSVVSAGCSADTPVVPDVPSEPPVTLRTESPSLSETTPPDEDSAEPTKVASSPPKPAPTPPAVSCPASTDWNTQSEKTTPSLADAEVVAIRPGWHGCFQRIVFDVHGLVDLGYSVGYVDTVKQQGSGKPLPVAGDGDLEVVVYTWARTLGRAGKYFLVREDFRADSPLTEVRFGGTHEGQATFAVGVKDKKPFAVHTWQNSGRTMLVIDIAQ